MVGNRKTWMLGTATTRRWKSVVASGRALRELVVYGRKGRANVVEVEFRCNWWEGDRREIR